MTVKELAKKLALYPADMEIGILLQNEDDVQSVYPITFLKQVESDFSGNMWLFLKANLNDGEEIESG